MKHLDRFIFLLIVSSFIIFPSCKKETAVPEPFVVPATADIVMYEVNVPAMSLNHDFQGVIDRLDSIDALGINTIWLMPVYPVGVVNSFGSPYCVKDYKAVNPNMGTMADLQNLVQLAHERGIAVILDWVANHTSWDNAWINNPGWYNVNAAGDIISPLGTTWTDVADLNFLNADMRLAMIDAMQYWIDEADIDGFRCDAADFVPFDFWKQALDSLKNNSEKELILLAEGARADHFTAGFQLNFSWSFLSTLKNVFNLNSYVSTLYSTNTSEYALVPAGSQRLRFTTNHDETNIAPPASMYGSQDAALAAAVITFYLQGVPLIYCGQEVGIATNSVYNGYGSINWTINADLHRTYKQLMKIYNEQDELRYGILQSYANANVAIFKKYIDNEVVLVMVNTRASTQTVTIDASLVGSWTNRMDNTNFDLPAAITMEPYAFYVLGK